MNISDEELLYLVMCGSELAFYELYNQLKDVYIMLLENALRYKIYRENGFLVENATERYIHFKNRIKNGHSYPFNSIPFC